MRRITVLLLYAASLLGVFITGTALVNAQDTAPTDLTGHLIVGSWLLDTDVDDPENGVTLATFTSDGFYIHTDQDGTTGHGIWESTGDTTAQLNFRLVDAEGLAIIRASVEVSAAGDTMTADYTMEFTDPTGQSTGEFGPGRAEGTRVMVEPMGEPAGTLADLFGAFEEPDATPAD